MTKLTGPALAMMATLLGCASSDGNSNESPRSEDAAPSQTFRSDATVLSEGTADGGSASADEAGASTEGGAMADASTMSSDIDPRDPVETIPTQDPGSLGLPTFAENAPGDLLISRTGRGCLSVDPAADLKAGSAVELGVCRGLPGQRWTVASSGLSLADAPELCLDAANGKVKLSRCADITTFKLAANDGVIERGDTALDVTGDDALISYGTHRGENQQWTRLSQDLAFLEQNRARTVSYPLLASDTLGYQIEEARHRVGMVQPPYPPRAPRDVSSFPGVVGASAPMISRRVHMQTRFHHDTSYLRITWPPKNWQSTGVYAPAGKLLVLDVLGAASDGLFVRINAHTDSLSPTSSNVSNGSFKRMPRVSVRVRLLPGKNAVRSPYGGEVIIESERDLGRVVAVEIHGGVEQPRFVRGVTSAQEWTRRRALDVPWAELEGDRTVITVPADQFRTLSNPDQVMERYDRVFALENELFGVDPTATSGVHRPYDGKARFVTDVQITAGSGHSGFPIMAMGWKLADSKTGGADWGIWHELGHNHQMFCLWSTRFGTEVTNNLYSLHAQQAFGQASRIANNYGPMITKLEANTVKWDELDDPWNELVFLMQPVHAFPAIGWDIYARVNRAYRELPETERSAVCGSEALQVDTFYKILSQACSADLRDHFTRWGFLPSTEARNSVAAAGLKAPSVVVWRAKP